MQDDFWSVKVAQGMGPLHFGMTRSEVAEALRQGGVGEPIDPFDSRTKILVPQINTTLVFSEQSQRLMRLDITDPRVKFATWDVIGKPIHKVVRFFKCPEGDTLWCDFYEPKEQEKYAVAPLPATLPTDAELLNAGTLWLIPFGLGCTVRAGTITTLHLCDAEHVPRFGTNSWNPPQRVMSETGRFPRGGSARPRNRWARFLNTVALVLCTGVVAFQAFKLQMRWNEAPDVDATIIAIDPPPPEPFGNTFTVQYDDHTGQQQRVALERMQFYTQPEMGEIVKIRFLAEAPDKPLGPARWQDAGFNLAIPYSLAILASAVALYFAFELLGL